MHRIIEIEWAVKNNKAFVPSPKRAKVKKHKRKKSESGLVAMDVDDNKKEFGMDLTNMDGDKPPLRGQKRKMEIVDMTVSSDEEAPHVRKSKRKLRG